MHLASASCDGSVKLWNINDGSVISTFEEKGAEITLATFSHNGVPALASGDEFGTLKFWNLTDSELVKTMDSATGPISTITVFNHTNKPHLAIGTNNVVELWE